MIMTNTITLEQLRAASACSKQVRRFEALFGDSATVTVDLCVKYAADFDWDFAAMAFLTAPALAEYDRVRDPALAEYDRVCATARAEYERVCAPARAEYERVCAPARAEYDRVCAAALEEFNRVRAPAWAYAFLSQKGDTIMITERLNEHTIAIHGDHVRRVHRDNEIVIQYIDDNRVWQDVAPTWDEHDYDNSRIVAVRLLHKLEKEQAAQERFKLKA